MTTPDPKFTLHEGNCLDVLRTFPENSIDSVVTDPPYGVGICDLAWDAGVPDAEIWAEVLRVLKPGGHLLAFAGTRTQHRMATQIELGGFEIRDVIAWYYVSGFPKNLDVSKAIDAQDAVADRYERALQFTAWMRDQMKASEIDRITGSQMGGHYTARSSQPQVATPEHFGMLRPHFRVPVPEFIEELVRARVVGSENMTQREVVDTRLVRTLPGNAVASSVEFSGSGVIKEYAVTRGFTPEARQWEGWGTALKPSMEPITMARKPIGRAGVADSVLRYGTGAINIDGCRIGERWPTNIIHDGRSLPEEMGEFFYCTKITREERNAGLPRGMVNTHPTVKPTDLMRYLCRLVTPPGGTVLDPFMGSGSTGRAAMFENFNFHGIDLDPEFIKIAHHRIADATNQRSLF